MSHLSEGFICQLYDNAKVKHDMKILFLVSNKDKLFRTSLTQSKGLQIYFPQHSPVYEVSCHSARRCTYKTVRL